VRYFEIAVGGQKKITAGSTTRIDLREQVLNFPSQPVITKDNVTIDIDAVLYYRIADPQKATYAVQNLPYALETLTKTTLRNIVGDMELDSTLASRDAINTRMREVIEEAAIGWGVDLTRVELQAIEPPRDIQQSMELQMRAERERRAAVTNAEAGKRAAILEAEGVRESQVRRAEGEKDAAILRAEGLATARLAMAEAEAEALRRVAAALPEGQAAMYLLGIKYLEALPKMTEGAGTTIFLPAEATGVMGAVGGLRELLAGSSRNAAARGSAPQSPPTRSASASPPQLTSGDDPMRPDL
jgi:regulator of protease activity HflC (stomatin/prohibitin superfamily)